MQISTNLSLMSLFEIAAHKGGSRSRLNPVLKSRIFGYRSGVCVIDLVQTIASLERISDFVVNLGKSKRQILIVGTSKHVRDSLPTFADSFLENSSFPYVDNRWLGGTLTNWHTVKGTLKKFEKLENIISNEKFFSNLTRNEQLSLERQKANTSKFFSGLKFLRSNRPGALLVLDAVTNPIAIKEAESINLPIIAVTNTSAKNLPRNLDYTLVCNTSSVLTLELVKNVILDSYHKGLMDGLVTPDSQVNSLKSEKNKTPFTQ